MLSGEVRSLYTLRTASDNICVETTLCSLHRDLESEGYAREMGSQSDDVLADGPFVVAPEEVDEDLVCVICGWPGEEN